MIQKLNTKLNRLGQSSSRALGSSAATELSGTWGTLRSRARRVMAMAMTASLKEMVRPVSIPPPFERSCGALMQVSFVGPSPHTTKKRDRVRRDASIHRESEKGCSRKPAQPFLCSVLHEYSARVTNGSKPM